MFSAAGLKGKEALFGRIIEGFWMWLSGDTGKRALGAITFGNWAGHPPGRAVSCHVCTKRANIIPPAREYLIRSVFDDLRSSFSNCSIRESHTWKPCLNLIQPGLGT